MNREAVGVLFFTLLPVAFLMLFGWLMTWGGP